MTITKQLAIGPVTFGGGGDRLDVLVAEQFVEDGRVVGSGERHLLQLKESAVKKLAGGGAWDNAHVEQLVRDAQAVDQPEILPQPEIPAITRDGKVIRPAVAAIDAHPATYRPKFDPTLSLVWPE